MKLRTPLLLALPLALTACDADLGSQTVTTSGQTQSVSRAHEAPSPDRYIVGFRPGRGLGAKHAVAARGGQHKLDVKGSDAFAAHLPAAALRGLRNHPDIEYIEVDAPRYPLGTLPTEIVPYGITMTEADQVALGGTSRTVCIIDSGYSRDHEDLQMSNVTASHDSGTGDPYYDDNGHGTHVAGTIAAIGGNGVGVRGVVGNGGLKLHIVKVFTAAGWNYSSSLTNAAQECADAGANVISMSLGGGTRSKTEDNKFKQLDAAGILSIAAAGNDGNNRHSYPASYNSVMSVAAVDDTGTWATFSQYTSQVEIAAPGVAVMSTASYLANNSVTTGGVTYAATGIEFAAMGTVSGELVDGGYCGASGSWAGKVVLCERGEFSFNDKVVNAEAGGAVATIIFNNEPGTLHATLGEGKSSSEPAIAISQADGQYLRANAIGASATVDSSYTFPATNGYEEYDGTSMATPHVSGVAALVWSHYPGKTNAEIRDALTASAEDRGAAGRDVYYGYGIVKAQAALEYLGGGTGGGGGDPVNQAPLATFSKDCTDLGCSFDASGSFDSDGTVVGYAWDFGDGSTATGASASHTYAASGSYVVTLTVTDDLGATSSASQTVSVADGSVALTISSVASASAKGRDFVITWTTSLPATSKVTFTCCGDFTDAALVTNHSMGFTGSKGATYEYTVSSTDALGNTVTAGPFIYKN